MPNTMHSFENNSSNVPAFLVKLWKLVEDPSCNDLIAWSDTGSSFIIWNQDRFSKELLPQYFKHSNMNSFIRQLNMYGFHKVANNDKGGLRNETDEMEFQHHLFVKEMSELLGFIKRKIPNSRISSAPTVKSNAAKDILTDLSSIREKQQNMNNMLHKMKQENDKLWRELSCMRQKHKAQEQIIQKVIQFLVSIVQQNKKNLGVGVQRKMAPMLKDTPMNKEKSQVTHTVNALRNKNANFITADQNKTVSPLGPVIHEVTESEHEQEELVDSPDVKSPGDKTDDVMSIPNSETSENDCYLNSSLDIPICTPANIELLSILKPLQQNYSELNADGSSLEESIFNSPAECLSLSNNMISIPQETYDNVISLPDATEVSSYSYIPNQEMSVYTSAKSDFDDFMSESFHSPQIPTIHIEDSCLSPVNSENNQEVSQEHNVIKNKYNIHNEHNYQLPLSNSLSVLKSSKLAKNTISNHLSDVDEVLKNIFRDISPNPLNTDPKQFLELISTDDIAKNEIVFGETGSQENNKTESSNIIGNELVQFTPSMFEYNLDDYQFFESLNQDALVPTGSDIQDIDNQKNFLLANVLNNTDQTTASEAAEYLLNGGFAPKHKSSQHPKIPKQQKAKRRKVT